MQRTVYAGPRVEPVILRPWSQPHGQSMRTIIVTIGACMLVGGISLAVRHALEAQQNSYSMPAETGVLWYALGGPTPDRVAWLGADGVLGWFLSLPLDLVLVIGGTGIAVIGLSRGRRR